MHADLGDLYDDDPIITVAERDTQLPCPIVRLTRLLEYQCNAMGASLSDCTHLRQFPNHPEILKEVAKRDICLEERNALQETLVYEPVAVDLGDIAPDVANR